MRIGVILSYDVYNIPTSHIVKELIKRGHVVELYALHMDYIHIRMFFDFDIQIRPFEELTKEIISKWDCIYSSFTIQGFPRDFWNVEKYIFHFTTTPYDEPGGFGDFTFSQRDMSNNLILSEPAFERMKSFEVQPGKVTGNPKYSIENTKIFNNIEKKQILFVDASHSPDSKSGKMEEAKMLVSIAKTFPEYKLVIKPRYFKNDKHVSHRNGVFLDDCIYEASDSDVPSNIEYLKEHIDLETISMESEIIITPDLTSTYCNAGAYNKRGIIASGFVFEYPKWKRHKRLFAEISARSGLFVDYDKIVQFLPEGKTFDKKNLHEMGLDILDGAQRIVDTIENVNALFLSKKLYPLKSDCMDDGYIDSMTQLISRRYIKALYGPIEVALRDVEGCDFSDAEKYVNNLLENNSSVNANDYERLQNCINDCIRKSIISSYQNGNRDYILQEYYIRAMYELNRFEEIVDDDFDAVEMLDYFRGRYEVDNSNYNEALCCFDRLINKISDSSFEQSLAYTDRYYVSSHFWAGVACYHIKNEKAKNYFESCLKLTDGNHRKAQEYLDMINKLD